LRIALHVPSPGSFPLIDPERGSIDSVVDRESKLRTLFPVADPPPFPRLLVNVGFGVEPLVSTEWDEQDREISLDLHFASREPRAMRRAHIYEDRFPDEEQRGRWILEVVREIPRD
jgi:hypothetical protein